MKNILIIALVVLKLFVKDLPIANAETKLEQFSKPQTVEQVQGDASKRQIQNVSSQGLQRFQQNTSLNREITSETTQLSERDRLIQERFLIKIIPAQNR